MKKVLKNKILNLEDQQINQNQNLLDSDIRSNKEKSQSPVKKIITGRCFQEIIVSLQSKEFDEPYNKLGSIHTPECCDLNNCIQKHKNIKLTHINTFYHGSLFNILDNDFAYWIYDYEVYASSFLRADQYFRGDVLRIMFDYLLNGPDHPLMWVMKSLLASHWRLHPPCLTELRDFYKELLYCPYSKLDCYFKTELSSVGILNHTIKKLEETPESIRTTVCEESSAVPPPPEEPATITPITYELLEERYNNFEPLLDNEEQEVMEALDDIQNNSMIVMPTLSEEYSYIRLVIGLEVVVDLLEDDFLICVAKLKIWLSSEDNNEHEKPVPLITHFIEDDGLEKVFTIYANTPNEDEWTQLSRLIGVVAETKHLFKSSAAKCWLYPDIDDACNKLANSLANIFITSEWTEKEKLLRLQTLRPDWLRLEIAMALINKELNVAMVSDLKAIVDIIHMHVKSTRRLGKDLEKLPIQETNASSNVSTSFIKKATKRNQYGENMLHKLCKNKKSQLSDIQNLLDMQIIDINAADNYGWTPLHEAVVSESIEKTKLLLDYRPPQGRSPVNLVAQNKNGSTPLHEAVDADNLEMCILLLEYGGVCLLNKMDCEKVTPLKLAKEKPDINNHFHRLLKVQEKLNLSPDSELNLPDYLIQMLIVANDAFLLDHYTWPVHCIIRLNESFQPKEPKKWIPNTFNTLVKCKEDQEQFRKLRKIVSSLAENPKNSLLIKLWNSKFQIPQNQTSDFTSQLHHSQATLIQNHSDDNNNAKLLDEALRQYEFDLNNKPSTSHSDLYNDKSSDEAIKEHDLDWVNRPSTSSFNPK